MTDEKYNPDALRRGTVLFGEEFTRKVLDELAEWDADFSRAFQDFVYDAMYDREVLDQRTRELLAVAACTCLNALPQLKTHAVAAARVGATVREIQEVVMQMSVYAGMPYMLQAVRHVNTFVDELRAIEPRSESGS